MSGNEDEDLLEPVLLVPPTLAKSAYKTLVDAHCVPRRWHREGRYGSRTHRVGNKIGLPLLNDGVTAEQISTILSTSSSAQNHQHSQKDAPQEDRNNKYHQPTTTRDCCGLSELLSQSGVELVFQPPILSNRIPKDEPFDATVHPDRAPQTTNHHLKGSPASSSSRTHGTAKQQQSYMVQTAPTFTFAELFAGIGGFGVALEALGGRCVFASEISESCKRTYRANMTTLAPSAEGDKNNGETMLISGDIWDIPSDAIPSHDILVGGFPCQPFSSLGDQPGFADTKKGGDGKQTNGGRGLLFTQIVRVLKDCQPQAFLLENVQGLVHTDDGRALTTILSALEGAGYNVWSEVISSRCLTAQARKRLYIVGLRRCCKTTNGDNLEQQQTSSLSFEFPFIPDLGLRAVDILHTEEELQSKTNLGMIGFADNPAAVLRISDSQMDHLLHRSKAWKPAKLAWPNTVCDTLDSHYGVSVGKGHSQLVPCLAPHHPRRFTPRECARLMGFRNAFVLEEYSPKSGQGQNAFLKEQYRKFGNAVCPPIVAAISGAILARCRGIVGFSNHNDWVAFGRSTAIELALDAVSPTRRDRDLVAERV